MADDFTAIDDEYNRLVKEQDPAKLQPAPVAVAPPVVEAPSSDVAVPQQQPQAAAPEAPEVAQPDPLLQSVDQEYAKQKLEETAIAVKEKFGEGSVEAIDAEYAALKARERPGVGSAFAGGVERGINQLETGRDTFQGIAAELSGDRAGVLEQQNQIKRREAEQTPSLVPSLADVYNPSDMMYWVSERLGEQVPVLGMSALGGGIGALTAKAVSRGLVSAKAGAAIGGYTAASGMETAGTAQEQFEATKGESYNPGLSTVAGLTKGAFEIYAPTKFLKGLSAPGKSIASETLKTAFREGATELVQEAIDVGARNYTDPAYGFLNAKVGWRLADSAVAGFVVGGGYGGTILAAQKAAGLDPLGPENKTFTKAELEALLNDGAVREGPLSRLRSMAKRKLGFDTFVGPEVELDQQLSDVGHSSMLGSFKNDWRGVELNTERAEKIRDFEDDNLPRYVMLDENGDRSAKIMTSAEVTEELAKEPTKRKKVPQFIQVNMGSLSPAGISATVWDLPDNGQDARVFTLPDVAPEVAQKLKADFTEFISTKYQPLKQGRFESLKNEETATDVYNNFLSKGLRVIPSRGSGFFYGDGPFSGKRVENVKAQRGVQTVDAKDGAFGKVGTVYKGTLRVEDIRSPVAIDYSRVPEGSLYAQPSPDYEGERHGKLLQALFENFQLTKHPENITPEVANRHLYNAWMAKDYAEIKKLYEKGIYITPHDTLVAVDVVVGKALPESAIVPGINLKVDGPGLPFTVSKTKKAPFEIVLDKGPRRVWERTSIQDVAKARQALESMIPVVRNLFDRLGLKDLPKFVLKEAGENENNVGSYFWETGEIHLAINNNWGRDGLDLGPFIATLFHELGHLVTIASFANLPAVVQAQVRQDHETAKMRNRLARESLGSNPARLNVPRSSPYYLTLVEHTAEQFRRFVFSDPRVLTDMQKYYREGGKALQALYSELSEIYKPSVMNRIVQADPSFYEWVQFLEMAASQGNVGVVQFAKALKSLPALDKTPDPFVGTRQRILDAIDTWRHVYPASTQIQIEGSPPEPGVVATTHKELNIVKFFLAAIASENPTRINQLMVHEAFHLIAKTLSSEEYNLLLAEAKRVNSLSAEHEGFYNALYRGQFEAMGLQGIELDWLVRGYVDEERVAFLIEQRMGGYNFNSVVNKILDKLIELWNTIRGIVKSSELKTVDQVLRAFYKGELARRYDSKKPEDFVAARITDMLKRREEAEKHKEAATTISIQYKGKTFTAYRGVRKPEKFVTRKYLFASSNPGVANTYTQEGDYRDDYADRSAVFPLEITFKNPFVIDAKGATWNKLPPNPKQATDPWKTSSTETWAQWADEKGYDGLIVENVIDSGTEDSIDLIGTTFVALKPSNVKSKTTNELLYAVNSSGGTVQMQPDKVAKMPDGNYMAVQYMKTGGQVTFANYRFFLPPSGNRQKAFAGAQSPLEQLDNLGLELGYVDMTWEGELKGWDIAYMTTHPAFRRQGFNGKFLKQIEADLKIKPIRASGIFEPDGYETWKKRAPAEVKYHVYDPVAEQWYSPNYVKSALARWERVLREAKLKKASPEELAGMRANLVKYTKLFNSINEKVWKNPKLKYMHALAHDGMVENYKRAQDKNDADLLKAVTGKETELTTQLEDVLKSKDAEGNPVVAEAAVGMKIMDYILQGENNPEVRKRLAQVKSEGIRIGWFSKMFWSLQQLAWNNPNIRQLQRYMELSELWNTFRMGLVNKADETAKEWYKLGNEQRRALSKLLFWSTEMKYLSQAERTAGIKRHPNPVELKAEMTRLKFTANMAALYNRIGGDFLDFLAEIETSMVENIQRTLQGNPTGIQAALAKLQAEMNTLKAKPYFPMTRFGQFFLTVRDQQTKEVVWFSAYATVAERDAATKRVALKYRGDELTIGRIPEQVLEFMGIPPALLQQIRANLPGLTKDQEDWIKQFELMNAPENSFKKRMLERDGIPGYSLDALRVYSQYFRSGANYLARIKFRPLFEETVSDLEKSVKNGTIRDTSRHAVLAQSMREHFTYIMEGGKDWAKFKGLVTVWQLGGSVAAAGMNLTQNVVLGYPYLASFFGDKKALRRMLSNNKGLSKARGIPTNAPTTPYQIARAEMIRQGKIDTGQASELGGFAEANNLDRSLAGTLAQKTWRGISYYSMFMFSAAEKYNREVMFKTAFELAMENQNLPQLKELGVLQFIETTELQARLKMSEAEAISFLFARTALDKTQFMYSPYSRPSFLRSPFTSSLMIFVSFPLNMLYAMNNNPGQLRIWLIMGLLYGAAGLPFSDDLDRLLNGLARLLFGKDFSIQREARVFVRSLTQDTFLDKTGPDLFMHGISRYSFGPGLFQEGYGVPKFDASSLGTMGKLIPGFTPGMDALMRGQKASEVMGEITQDIAGAGFGQMFTLMKLLGSSPGTEEWKQWEKMLPRTLKGASKGTRYGVTGQETNTKGSVIQKFDATDPDDIATMAAQFLGFTPTELSEKYEAQRSAFDLQMYYKTRRLGLYGQLDYAVRKKDPEAKADVLTAIKKFNAEVKDAKHYGMVITSEGISKSLNTRARNRAIEAKGIPASKASRSFAKEAQDQYPGIVYEREEK